jgi:hypothetical protein
MAPGLRGRLPPSASTTDWMRYKLRATIAAALYRMRKAIVEPVFGQIKSVRGLRRILLRGLANVQDEFRLIAFTHNLLKLASPPGRASLESVTMAPLSSPKGHPSHASRRSARSRVGFRRTTTYGMESSRGAAALLSNMNQSRRRTGGAFAEGKSPTDS